MVEFGAGGAITHAEEPATTAEAQPAETAETPTSDGSAPPAVATGSAGEEASVPAAATGDDGAADSPHPPAVDVSQAPAEPVSNSTPEASPPPPPTDSTTPAQATPNVSPIAPVPPNPRRKRRAKGWFCPVCRQPYTSLLRITTAPPTMEDSKEGKRVSTSTIDHPLGNIGNTVPDHAPALEATPEEPAPITPSRSLRPVFLQRLQRRTTDSSNPV